MYELLTIPMSHYCEKVRWALEYLGHPYRERAHLQVFHGPVARRHSGGTLVPILLTEAGPIADSTRINRFLDEGSRRLYPEGMVDDILGWEEDFDEGLGVEGRRWVYLQVIDRPDFATYAAFGAPRWQLAAWNLFQPVFRFGMVRYLNITEEAVNAGMPVVEAALQRVEERLESGARYLVGDRFTAADLTFASLMSPLLWPERYGIPMPDLDILPASAARTIEGYRARPAGRFALRLIEEHRPVPLYQRGS